MRRRVCLFAASGLVLAAIGPVWAAVLPMEPPKPKTDRHIERGDREGDRVIIIEGKESEESGREPADRPARGRRGDAGPRVLEGMPPRQPGSPAGPGGLRGDMDARIQEMVNQAVRNAIPRVQERMQDALRERDERMRGELQQMIRQAVREALGERQGLPRENAQRLERRRPGSPEAGPAIERPAGPGGAGRGAWAAGPMGGAGGEGLGGPPAMERRLGQMRRRGGPPAMLGFEGGAPALRGGQAQGPGFGPRGKAFGRAEMFRERGLWPRIRARVAQHMRWRMFNRGAGDGAAMRRFGADGDRYLTAREFRAAMKKLFQRLDREGRIGPEKSGKPDRGPRDGFGKMNKKKTEEKRRPRSGAGRPMDREE